MVSLVLSSTFTSSPDFFSGVRTSFYLGIRLGCVDCGVVAGGRGPVSKAYTFSSLKYILMFVCRSLPFLFPCLPLSRRFNFMIISEESARIACYVRVCMCLLVRDIANGQP